MSKMVETTNRIVQLLKREKALKISEIPTIMDIPKRRIYDILAIMEGLKLITREKGVASWIFKTANIYQSGSMVVKSAGWFKQVHNKGREVVLESTEGPLEVREVHT